MPLGVQLVNQVQPVSGGRIWTGVQTSVQTHVQTGG
jgi:hypothetical protein